MRPVRQLASVHKKKTAEATSSAVEASTQDDETALSHAAVEPAPETVSASENSAVSRERRTSSYQMLLISRLPLRPTAKYRLGLRLMVSPMPAMTQRRLMLLIWFLFLGLVLLRFR